MWPYNSTSNFALGFSRQCMCQTITRGACLCPNPMTSCCYNNNSNTLVNYQRPPTYGFSHANFLVENYGQEATDQMATNYEMGSWLLSNTTDSYQIDHGGRGYGGNDQFIQMQTQTSLLPTVAEIVPEAATIGAMDLQREWALTQFSFPPFYPGNLTELEAVIGSYSNSTSISSVETRQQLIISRDDLQKPSAAESTTPMSRQDRIMRYIEKKKARKYEKKIIQHSSSRKTYAQTRPRIRGRFARSSQTDTN